MTSHERHQRLAGRLFHSCLRRLIRRRSFTFFPGAYHALYPLPAPNMLRPPFHIPLGAYEHGRLTRSFFALCIAVADQRLRMALPGRRSIMGLLLLCLTTAPLDSPACRLNFAHWTF